MWDEDMIRKSLMVFLVFLAVLLMAIGCGSIVASLKGEPLLTRYVNPPFLPPKAGSWGLRSTRRLFGWDSSKRKIDPGLIGTALMFP
jgi:hypothetical protein